ncbi:hypothetical protein EIN_096950 [Entamoeba invadens IP1]|uniref:Uncharacterized protein n=1 Tax=Entamoeba invadens IP1 TaxID=370355 RepID=A0A0A1U406_ENTIV|nr:hypothetical protein EIN_096950 [Entamoeba invadens IP1]ELP87428.1 hypothetical protein EIN_096950 [Entamoeba invadens IP1]|eukprot:XP_004254199.1 hypothetical protein EIN_096950 [Entamoeba invadens IP1]
MSTSETPRESISVEDEIQAAKSKIISMISIYNKTIEEKKKYEERTAMAYSQLELVKKELELCIEKEESLQRELESEKKEHQKAIDELESHQNEVHFITGKCVVQIKDGNIQDIEVTTDDHVETTPPSKKEMNTSSNLVENSTSQNLEIKTETTAVSSTPKLIHRNIKRPIPIKKTVFALESDEPSPLPLPSNPVISNDENLSTPDNTPLHLFNQTTSQDNPLTKKLPNSVFALQEQPPKNTNITYKETLATILKIVMVTTIVCLVWLCYVIIMAD